ncbi:LuxR C-terminal-related transcriptional regulator [Streptomyces sp. NPDC002088]|uniref:LuxR C-terminal-related transcriptional regulator n=1 Tax=Streptomyces sp. NPDC002088 TaxID=3154665 RepID=UPI003328F2F8
MIDATVGSRPVRYATTFAGRERERETLRHAVQSNRFVGLIGPAGVGKTRLVTEVAQEWAGQYDNGVFVADVSEVREPGELCSCIAAAVGMRENSSLPLKQITEGLQQLEAVIVLDGCELLGVDGVAMVQELLQAGDRTRFVATSRRAIYVDGGTLMTLAPLPVPSASAWTTAEGAVSYASVQLFAERARLVRPDFSVTEHNAEAVASLCRRLDGLPLAIELAASWVRALSVEQIIDRMQASPDFPRAGTQNVAPRHRELRSLTAGTYELCSEVERLLWCRLTIFDGTFDLTAVEAVCGAPPLDGVDLLDVLVSLVDQSVVVVDNVTDPSRYRLLRVTRDYGNEKLDSADIRQQLADRRMEHYERVLSRFTLDWPGPGQFRRLEQLQLDYPNAMAAIDHGLASSQGAVAVRMAADLWNFWFVSGRLTEGLGVLRRVLAVPSGGVDAADRVRALYIQAYLCVLRDELRSAEKLLQTARSDYRGTRDGLNEGLSLQVDAMVEMAHGRLNTSRERLEQALAIYERLDSARARVLFMDASGVAVLLAALSGDSAQALALGHRGLTACDEYEDVMWRGYIEYAQGVNAWMQNNLQSARQSALSVLRSSHDQLLLTHCVELLAWCDSRGGRHQAAARLFGVADRMWSVLGGYFSGFRLLAEHRERCLDDSRGVLGEPAFDKAYIEGGRLSRDELLEAASEQGPVRPKKETTAPLTARELEVAHLLTQGMSNRQIARTLAISPRTAESHVDHILTKLGLVNRTQVATWMLYADGDGQSG